MKLFILEDVQLKKRLAKIYQKGSGLYIEGAKAPQTLYQARPLADKAIPTHIRHHTEPLQ